MALIVLYVGVKGYFTKTTKLNKLPFTFSTNLDFIARQKDEDLPFLASDLDKVTDFMKNKKPYLNPDLNLSDLSISLNFTRAELSKIINTSFGKNFNDFINEYRVNAFKAKLEPGEHQQLSLLGILMIVALTAKQPLIECLKKLRKAPLPNF